MVGSTISHCRIVEGYLALVDFNRYGVAEQPGMSIALSDQFGFDYYQTYVRVITRFDGAPLDGTLPTPKNGNRFSSTVTLETRS